MPSLVAEACSVLGLEPGPKGAPPDEEAVSVAFKKLAIKWHPDRNPQSVQEATQRFAEISAARDLLLDPPVNALLDEATVARGAGAASYHKPSPNLRAFEGDVTEEIDSGSLRGSHLVHAFTAFELWAVWKCDGCNAVCCRIRKNKYSCMCSHRLKDHDAGNGFRCTVGNCGCNRYVFMVQDSTEPHKCRCKHKPSEHASTPPYGCLKCGDCKAFDSPWVCNCGHAPREHRTAFVKHKYAERAREWVAGGLRGECVAMANKFRQRSAADRAAFIQRAAAAKAAGFPSWKAAQRQQRLHDQYGTQPPRPATPQEGGGGGVAAERGAPFDADRCGECEPTSAGISAAGGDFVAGPASLSTAELREKLAAAGIGVRPGTCGGSRFWSAWRRRPIRASVTRRTVFPLHVTHEKKS